MELKQISVESAPESEIIRVRFVVVDTDLALILPIPVGWDTWTRGERVAWGDLSRQRRPRAGEN
jgi:hypothetical protein